MRERGVGDIVHSSIITCNVFAMVKQAGKSHSYPSSRSSYATSRKGIGGRPGRNANMPISASKTSTMFNHFQRQQSKSGM